VFSNYGQKAGDLYCEVNMPRKRRIALPEVSELNPVV
jgi:hypothetical protein